MKSLLPNCLHPSRRRTPMRVPLWAALLSIAIVAAAGFSAAMEASQQRALAGAWRTSYMMILTNSTIEVHK